jgi:glycosyltransferase involved in cell wall biosynthesis
MANHNTIGAVIVNYNQGNFLTEALEALLLNTELKEIVIVDDASLDNSIEIIESFKNIKLIKNEFRMGVSKSFNKAIDIINTDYVLIQGADDISLPTRAGIQKDLLNANPNNALINNNSYIDINSTEIESSAFGQNYSSSYETFFNLFNYGNQLCAPASAFPKELYMMNGGFSPNLQQLQDFFFWLNLAKENKIVFANENVVKYRIHGNNLSLNLTPIKTIRLNREMKVIYRKFFIAFTSGKLNPSLIKPIISDQEMKISLVLLKFYMGHANPAIRELGVELLNECVLDESVNVSDLEYLGLTYFDLILLNGNRI